jgi:hypothetical protein
MEKTSDGPLVGPAFLNMDQIDIEEVKKKTLEELMWFTNQRRN